MSKPVYIVFGTEGEYSDRTEWAVAAYFSEEKAKEHVVKASHRANELIALWREADDPWKFEEANRSEFDPKMQWGGYTGVSYYYANAPLLDA